MSLIGLGLSCKPATNDIVYDYDKLHEHDFGLITHDDDDDDDGIEFENHNLLRAK